MGNAWTTTKSEVIQCPECHGTHIRMSQMVEQVIFQEDDHRQLIEEVDCTTEYNEYPALYTCLDDACGHDWTSNDDDTEDDE